MNIEQLQMDREAARAIYRKYLEQRAHHEPHDKQITQIYERLSRGETVIYALDAIRRAGCTAEGLPRLAIARCDMPFVYLHVRERRGAAPVVCFGERAWWLNRRRLDSKNIRLEWPRCPVRCDRVSAVVPAIPAHLRPRRGIQNYFVLFEAAWGRAYPIDPYLLRRFGPDAWAVVAGWELTESERAVMSQRVGA